MAEDEGEGGGGGVGKTADGDPEKSTILHARRSVEPPLLAAFSLVALSGPDRGSRWVIDASRSPRTLIGQSPVCEVQLHDPVVSRRHAALELSPTTLRISDLQSTNGTRIGGLSIEAALLRGGERIEIGETVLAVEPCAAAAPPSISRAMRFGRLIGASAAMRRLYPRCELLAASDIPVVIEGETGTGKEVLAEAIHEASPRKDGPFVVFDCTAVAPTLVEAVLFGHERGAFTGAVSQKAGVFEEAHRGTLLIDELGELDLSLQPKLLRVLERGEIQRVGSTKWIPVDVRVLAATRRDLDRELAAGRFRDDLFFRLAVGRIELPPLRSRAGDVAVLARHFWHKLGGDPAPIPPALLERFEEHSWPGNVRELHHAVARYLALGDADGDGGEAGLLPAADGAAASYDDPIERVIGLDLPLARAREKLVEEFERRYVQNILARHDGNVVRAAAAAGIARRYFQILRAKRK